MCWNLDRPIRGTGDRSNEVWYPLYLLAEGFLLRFLSSLCEESKKTQDSDALNGDALSSDLQWRCGEFLAAAARDADITLALGLTSPAMLAGLTSEEEAHRKREGSPSMDMDSFLNEWRSLGIRAVGGNMLSMPCSPPYAAHQGKENGNTRGTL